jgi:Domain of unknown function (DUF4326)
MIESRSPKRVKARVTGVRGYKNVMRKTKYGNPFDWKVYGLQESVDLYIRWLAETPEGQAIAAAAKIELRGHDLGCTCPLDGPCHADVLLRVANEPHHNRNALQAMLEAIGTTDPSAAYQSHPVNEKPKHG